MLAGVRAEEILLGNTDGISSTVLSKEYLGADTLLCCKVGTEKILVRAGRVLATEVGDSVRLSWPPDAMHLFDATSGRRVDLAS